MNRETEDLNDNEIDDLTREIEGLSLQLETLREKLATANRRQRNRPPPISDRVNRRQRNRPLTIGNRVRITNKYKGRQGLTGVITRTTNAQAYVRPDGGGETFRSYKANLQRLTE